MNATILAFIIHHSLIPNSSYPMKRNIVVAITGASGVTYSVRLLEVLLAAGCDVHLTISAAGQVVLKQELDLSVDLDNFTPAMLMLDAGARSSAIPEAATPSAAWPASPAIRATCWAWAPASRARSATTTYGDYLAPIASGSFPTDGMVVCPCSTARSAPSPTAPAST